MATYLYRGFRWCLEASHAFPELPELPGASGASRFVASKSLLKPHRAHGSAQNHCASRTGHRRSAQCHCFSRTGRAGALKIIAQAAQGTAGAHQITAQAAQCAQERSKSQLKPHRALEIAARRDSSKKLFKLGVTDTLFSCALHPFTLLSFAPCMYMHGFALVYIYICMCRSAFAYRAGCHPHIVAGTAGTRSWTPN